MNDFNWFQVSPKIASLAALAHELKTQSDFLLEQRQQVLKEADEELRTVVPSDPYIGAEPHLARLVRDALVWVGREQSRNGLSAIPELVSWPTPWLMFTASPRKPLKSLKLPDGMGRLWLSLSVRVVEPFVDKTPNPDPVSQAFDLVYGEEDRKGVDREDYGVNSPDSFMMIHHRIPKFAELVKDVIWSIHNTNAVVESWRNLGAITVAVTVPVHRSVIAMAEAAWAQIQRGNGERIPVVEGGAEGRGTENPGDDALRTGGENAGGAGGTTPESR